MILMSNRERREFRRLLKLRLEEMGVQLDDGILYGVQY